MPKKLKSRISTNLPLISLIVCFSVLLLFGSLVTHAQWEEPEFAPPKGQVPAPINVGLDNQYKQGYLAIGTEEAHSEAAVYGKLDDDHFGYLGYKKDSVNKFGVYGKSKWAGVRGEYDASRYGQLGTVNYGVYGLSSTLAGVMGYHTSGFTGSLGYSEGGVSAGVWAYGKKPQWAGYFWGNVKVTGKLEVDGEYPGAYWDQSGENLWAKDPGWNVGIGAANPGYRLDVQGPGGSGEGPNDIASIISTDTGYSEGARLLLGSASNPNAAGIAGQYTYDGRGELRFYTDTKEGELTQKAVITSTGKVGIGTTSPDGKLAIVDDSGYYRGKFRFGGSVLSLQETNASPFPYIEWRNREGKRGLYFGWGHPGNYIMMGLENNNNLAIMGGKVGIGTTDPKSMLQIWNTNEYDGTENNFSADSIGLYGSPIGRDIGDYFGGITWHNNWRRRAGIASVMESTDSDYVGLAFFTRGTDGAGPMDESVRISHSGNVGIGTTNPGAYSAKLASIGNAYGVYGQGLTAGVYGKWQGFPPPGGAIGEGWLGKSSTGVLGKGETGVKGEGRDYGGWFKGGTEVECDPNTTEKCELDYKELTGSHAIWRIDYGSGGVCTANCNMVNLDSLCIKTCDGDISKCDGGTKVELKGFGSGNTAENNQCSTESGYPKCLSSDPEICEIRYYINKTGEYYDEYILEHPTGISASGYGVHASGGKYGIYAMPGGAVGDSPTDWDAYGVYGKAGQGIGVYGESSKDIGVYGQGATAGVYGTGPDLGKGFLGYKPSFNPIWGGGAPVKTGVYGTSGYFGVVGVGGGASSIGVYGTNDPQGASGAYAGYFEGDVKITGRLEVTRERPWHIEVGKFRCNREAEGKSNRQWTFEDGFIPSEMQMYSWGDNVSDGTVWMELVLDDDSTVRIQYDEGPCATSCGGWKGWKREWGIFSKIPNGRTVKAVGYHCWEDHTNWYGGFQVAGTNLGRPPSYHEWN